MKMMIMFSTCFILSVATQWTRAQGNSVQPGMPLGLKDAEMSVKLMSPINTKTSRSGDKFSVLVLTPATYSGAIIEAHIASIDEAKHRDKAEVSFQFETLNYQRANYPIRADLKEVANSQGVKNVDEEGRAIGKSSKKKAVESALVGAAAGSLLGALMGGGQGAAIGAGAGAGAGLLFSIKFTTSGSQIDFAPGTTFLLDVSDRKSH